MKIYVAARFDMKEKTREIYKKIKNLGHEIIADWTLHKLIYPYDKNQELSKEYAIEDINAVKDCDVFIIISNDGGSTGSYVELGSAIASNIEHNKPKIYVVGENNSRSMFYFHPLVNRRDNIEQVLEELKRMNT